LFLYFTQIFFHIFLTPFLIFAIIVNRFTRRLGAVSVHFLSTFLFVVMMVRKLLQFLTIIAWSLSHIRQCLNWKGISLAQGKPKKIAQGKFIAGLLKNMLKSVVKKLKSGEKVLLIMRAKSKKICGFHYRWAGRQN